MSMFRAEFINAKCDIRGFIRDFYNDERLAHLLASAQSDILRFHSCCCLVGTATLTVGRLLPDFPLVLGIAGSEMHSHSVGFESAFGGRGRRISRAFQDLRYGNLHAEHDALRRRILIPMIRAEMRRRERLASPQANEYDTVAVEVA